MTKWDLTFTLQGYLYKAIKTGSNVIKKVITRVHDTDDIEAEDQDAYSYFIEEDVVFPWESLEEDDWVIHRTVNEEGRIVNTTEEKT